MKDGAEADWKTLRALSQIALDRYCARVLDECAAVIRDEGKSSHERYLELFKLIHERDDRIAAAFNDMRRSRAVDRLAHTLALGVLTDEELARFSPGFLDTAQFLSGIRRR
jgi:hypothetical protein